MTDAKARRCSALELSSVLQGKLDKKGKKTETGSDVKTDESSDHLPLIIQRTTTKKQETSVLLEEKLVHDGTR